MKNCPKCGAAVSDTAKFCNQCAFNIREYEEAREEMLCPKCNLKYPAGNRCCEECGGTLVSAASSFNIGGGLGAELLTKCEVGAELTFGTFNGKPIEWKVIAADANKALIISKSILTKMAYNDTLTGITWEECTLRGWLNNDFLNTAFNGAEQAKIQSTSLNNPDNHDYKTKGGNVTNDKIFLLGIDEAKSYFSSDDERISEIADASNKCYWFLRSPGCNQGHVASVEHDGDISPYGYYVDDIKGGVRPAMWINM